MAERVREPVREGKLQKKNKKHSGEARAREIKQREWESCDLAR